MEIINLLLLAGAIAWSTTAIVAKPGPFNVLGLFRELVKKHTGVLNCFHCASFWIGLLFTLLYISGELHILLLIQFFGILGISQALRGASGEWN